MSSDMFIIKTDGNGIEQWKHTFGENGYDYGESVEETNDGGYIISGWTTSFGSGLEDIYLLKVNNTGIVEWGKTFGGVNNEQSFSIDKTNDGGYIITGSTNSGNWSNKDVYLIKTDSQGDSLWTKTYGGIYDDEGHSVQQTIDGGYIITGFIQDFNGFYNVYLIKTDGGGTEQWSQTFGDIYDDVGYSVQQTIDGGYIISGITEIIHEMDYDIYLIKTDGNGNVTSTFNIPINPNRKLDKVVDILGREIKHQTNTPFIEIYDDGSTEKKIVVE